MYNKENYIPKEQRKKLVFISDDILGVSGVANQAKNIILGTAHYYNWVSISGAINHPEKNQRTDVSPAIDKETGLTDSNVIRYPTDGYGNPDMIRAIIKLEKPDGIVFITDPRQYDWLFRMEHEIRTQGIKMIYINIWDETGLLPFWNYSAYASCDGLLAISKQTKDINERVLTTLKSDYKPYIKYFPHGINKEHFKPVDESELVELKKELYKGKEYEFMVFFNSRNIRRKSIPDLIMAFKLFLDKLESEEKDKCVLVLHTRPVDENGTDLHYVTETVLGERRNQVIFDEGTSSINRLNLLYNLADVTCLISSNEGFGLSGAESMMSGTPIIVNVTGGMQDYCRFTDEEGEWYNNSELVPSNNEYIYSKHGEWVFPVFPSNISIQGSVLTPAIFDSRASFHDVALELFIVYHTSKEERKQAGLRGREWLCSDEAKMSMDKMCSNFINYTDDILQIPQTRKKYEIKKVSERPLRYTENIFCR